MKLGQKPDDETYRIADEYEASIEDARRGGASPKDIAALEAGLAAHRRIIAKVRPR